MLSSWSEPSTIKMMSKKDIMQKNNKAFTLFLSYLDISGYWITSSIHRQRWFTFQPTSSLIPLLQPPTSIRVAKSSLIPKNNIQIENITLIHFSTSGQHQLWAATASTSTPQAMRWCQVHVPLRSWLCCILDKHFCRLKQDLKKPKNKNEIWFSLCLTYATITDDSLGSSRLFEKFPSKLQA